MNRSKSSVSSWTRLLLVIGSIYVAVLIASTASLSRVQTIHPSTSFEELLKQAKGISFTVEVTPTTDTKTEKDELTNPLETEQVQSTAQENSDNGKSRDDHQVHEKIPEEIEEDETNQNTGDNDTISVEKDPKKTFSACLLILDQSNRLQEWLAYHYHVLPLRHLIVATNPKSKRVLEPMFDLFRQQLGMDITVWTDPDFGFETILRDKREVYRARLRKFLKVCLEHFHHHGHEWTAIFNSDEYVAIEPRTKFTPFSDVMGETSLRKPGGVLRYIHKAKEQGILKERCIVTPKSIYGAKEETDFTEQSSVPTGLDVDPFRMDTLRWRYHSKLFNKLNGLGKPLIDVSSLGPYLPLSIKNPHRLVFGVCPSSIERDTITKSPFRANYYVGSWEEYDQRDGSKIGSVHSHEDWQLRAKQADEVDTLTPEWLGGFVESVGLERANTILSGTGIPRVESTLNDTHDNSMSSSSSNMTDSESFSACLLVLDENHRLREWLAYHYHVLPLRYVVVAVDPKNKQSPSPIFDEFRQQLGMQIVEWSDADFGFEADMSVTDVHEKRSMHLSRQRQFLKQCLEHMHDTGRGWTACYDTDEYVTIEPMTEFTPFDGVTGETTLREAGGVMRYIQKAKSRGILKDTCIMMPRSLFGANEEVEFTDVSSVSVGLGVDPFRLDTVRWRYHARRFDKLNGQGKPLVDASSLGPYIPFLVRNPHRVVFEVCSSPSESHSHKFSAFRANHYLGSWEQYSFKDDARKGSDKSREAWEFRSDQRDRFDNVTHQWLEGFVASVGVGVATGLLKDNGLPREYRNENDHEWRVDTNAKAFRLRSDDHHDNFLKWVAEKRGQNFSTKAGKREGPAVGKPIRLKKKAKDSEKASIVSLQERRNLMKRANNLMKKAKDPKRSNISSKEARDLMKKAKDLMKKAKGLVKSGASKKPEGSATKGLMKKVRNPKKVKGFGKKTKDSKKEQNIS